MKRVALAIPLLMLGACSTPPPPPAAPPEPKAAHVDNPLDPLLKTRDRAKAVQGNVDTQAADQRAAIDAQDH
jgi:hypothetical protein